MARTWTARIIAAALAGVLALGTTSVAGPVDSPLPNLGVGTTTPVFYVPGVVKNNALETIFMCSNLDIEAVTLAVELFDAAGAGPLNNVEDPTPDGRVTLPVGGAASITTGSTVGFSEDEIINAATLIRSGTARIVATSPRIACTAFVTHDALEPPSSMYALEVVGRSKLQAGN